MSNTKLTEQVVFIYIIHTYIHVTIIRRTGSHEFEKELRDMEDVKREEMEGELSI